MKSLPVAFCALMAALGAILMAAGGLIPVATYCSPLIASVLLLPVMSEHGERWAWMTWAVTAALSLLLSIDREAAFFYLFSGYYPMLRPRLDAAKPRGLRVLSKLAFFALSLGSMYALLLWVFQLNSLQEDFGTYTRWMGLGFFAALIGVMLLYDFTLKRVQRYWLLVLRPRLFR